MKILDSQSDAISKNKPWYAVFQLLRERDTVAEWFKSSPQVEWPIGRSYPDSWVVQFDCGLLVGFEFGLHDGGAVFATEFSAQHILRHLNHWRKHMVEYPSDSHRKHRSMRYFATSTLEGRNWRGYQLWRQGDDGNPVRIGDPTTRRDAMCWQAQLESHKHKQIYWVSTC